MGRARLSQLEQERLSRGWTREQAAEQLAIDPATLRRWEKGLHLPQPIYRQRLYTLYKKTAQELGLEDSEELIESPAEQESRCVAPPPPDVADAYTALRREDLAMRLFSLVWSSLLYSVNARYQELQKAIILELEGNHMSADPITRRDAIRQLAALPIEVCGLSLVVPTFLRPIEEILMHCAAGITACWYLRQGKDLTFTFDTASRYIPTLKEIVRTGSSAQRKDATELLTQVLLLHANLAKHITNGSDSINYAIEATKYAEASANPTLHILALRMQASQYSYANKWQQALNAAEKAKHQMELTLKRGSVSIHPLTQSFVYSHLAPCQAYDGQKQESLRTLGKAFTAFFAEQIDEPFPAYINHSQANLVLQDGLVHYHLGMNAKAFDSFGQTPDLPSRSTEIRIEALLNQALAEASREDKEPDMDLCIELWTQGIEEAKALRSLQRFNEATMAYATMRGVWRREKAIKDLRSLIVWPDEKNNKA